MANEHKSVFYPISKDKTIYNYYAKLLKVCEANLFALMIDLGFGVHKRINIRLVDLDYDKANEDKIIKYCNKFFENSNYDLMYFSYDPDSYGYMTGVIKSHDGVFNLNKLLVDNKLMFYKEGLGF